MSIEIVLCNETIRTPPCSLCDYVFCLMLGMAGATILWWFGCPWWFIAIYVHHSTASWFLKTRPWIADRKRP